MSNDELIQSSMAVSYGEDDSENNQSTSSSGGSAPHEEFNKLALDFRPVSTSKRDKCRNFWIFIDSNPELGQIKDIGHRKGDDPISECVSRRIHCPSPHNSVHRRKWLNQLVEYKQLNLDKATLSSDREKVSPIPRPLVLADQVSEPPEALHEALDRFDDQVKYPDPLQIYRAPVTLKDFLKKRQGQIQL